MPKAKNVKKPSGIFILHYCKLVYRSLLFLSALVVYVINRLRNAEEPFGGFERNDGILSVIWLVFAVEMLLRFSRPRWRAWAVRSSLLKIIRRPGRIQPTLSYRAPSVPLRWQRPGLP